MKLTGATIKLVAAVLRRSTACGACGPRTPSSRSRSAGSWPPSIERAGGDVVAGDCHLANTAITEQTGRIPQHPLQIVARAYGIPVEQPR